MEDVVFVGFGRISLLAKSEVGVYLLAITSFSIGKPIRFANHPASTSPKLPYFCISKLKRLADFCVVTSWYYEDNLRAFAPLRRLYKLKVCRKVVRDLCKDPSPIYTRCLVNLYPIVAAIQSNLFTAAKLYLLFIVASEKRALTVS